MSSLTPRYSEAIAEPRPTRQSHAASLTPQRGVPPARDPATARRAWTLLLMPPARTPGAVRRASLTRGHAIVAAVGLALLLGIASAGGARLGTWAHETRVAPELAELQSRLAGAEGRLRTLGDSLATLHVELARVASLAAPSALRSGAPARPSGTTAAARPRRALAFPLTGLVLPLDGRITSRFARSRVHPILRIPRPHRGIDIGAPPGTRIVAPAAGRVVKVGREMGYGLVVHLDHGNGVTTRYAHCQSTLVSRGQRVAVGTPIATVGATGLATRPHLHYEVRLKGVAVDPLRVSVR